jgi:hypothetical protein
MRRIAVVLVLVALPGLAAAADRPPDNATLTAPCAALAAGADYVPGIDAQGNAVVPADLPAAPSAVKSADITIKLDARLAASYGVSAAGTPAGKVRLGTITLRDGRAYLNGKPLDAGTSDAVIAACRAAKK